MRWEEKNKGARTGRHSILARYLGPGHGFSVLTRRYLVGDIRHCRHWSDGNGDGTDTKRGVKTNGNTGGDGKTGRAASGTRRDPSVGRPWSRDSLFSRRYRVRLPERGRPWERVRRSGTTAVRDSCERPRRAMAAGTRSREGAKSPEGCALDHVVT